MKKYLVFLGLACWVLAKSAYAQGSLTPSGAPAPTMKTLQQIYDRIDQLVATVSNQQRQIDYLGLSAILCG